MEKLSIAISASYQIKKVKYFMDFKIPKENLAYYSNLWQQRNNYLHNRGKTINIFEMTALDEETHKQWETGIG
jgi:hypothetical protein